MPDRLMTTKEVAKVIKKDERTTQQLGKAQIIKSSLKPMPRGGQQRMYEPNSVREYLANPRSIKTARQTPEKQPNTSVAVAIRKPSQADRALDTVTLLANVVATMNKDREMFLKALDIQSQLSAKTLENVLGTVLGRVFDAQRADREEAKAARA